MGRYLSVLDNLFWQLETPTTPMHVGGVLVFRDNATRPPDHLRAMRKLPATVHPFNMRVAPTRRGPPRWETVDDVDLDDHVAVHEARAPGDDAALMELVSDIHTQPVNRSKPMWECHMIDNLSEDRFALFYKIHHACIDGVTGIRRIQSSLSDDPEERTPAVWSRDPQRAPRPPRGPDRLAALRAARANARMVPELAREILRLRAGRRRGDEGRSAAPYSSPNTPLNQAVSGLRSVAWCRLPLTEVRAVGAATGATVNEVALALVSSILRDRLLQMGGLPKRPLVAMVPFSLRDARGDGAGGGSNAVSCILCNLATHVSDPLERLRIIRASSSDGKRMLRAMSPEAAATYWLVVGFPAIAAQLAGMRDRAPLPFNVVVSNVPGPRDSLYHSGAQLEAIYPASLLFERQALNVTLTSYRGHLDFGLLACRETIPDLPHLAQRLVDAFTELRAACGAEAATGASRA